ncbi:hypothetical protein BFL43_07715 [Williamsia sp. 1135]|nr:hypothetical protein BFL43_07715 [Williamsia sp. 1135]
MARSRAAVSAALAGTIALSIGVVWGNGVAWADSPSSTPVTATATGEQCAVIHVIADQGTNESGDKQDPKADAGMLSKVVVPVAAKFGNDPSKIDRTYVPYPADFGWRGKSYAESVTTGVTNTEKVIGDEAKRCPGTKFAVLGYSQGGQVADTVLRKIGNGQGPIDSDRVALGMLFSSPDRPDGAGLFPGADDQAAPAPVPGTQGASVTQVQAADQQAGEGGGIAPPIEGVASGFGDLTGRVASACIPGDLACDVPADAPVAKLVANVAGQLNLNQDDPVGILLSVANVVGTTTIKTAADVVNEDISTTDGTTAGLQYQPQETVLSRVTTASDPQYQPDIFAAVGKVLGIAMNTAITVAKKVLTPANIAEVATVGLANPAAGLAVFGAKLGSAALEMLPVNLVDKAAPLIVNEIKQDITDNQGLVRMAADVSYWNVAKHNMYDTTPLAATGASAVEFGTNWIIAAITDLLSSAIADSTPDASAFTPTVPVNGEGSYNGLPGLQLPAVPAQPATDPSYQPWQLDGDDSADTTATPSSSTSTTSTSTSSTTSTSTPITSSDAPAADLDLGPGEVAPKSTSAVSTAPSAPS